MGPNAGTRVMYVLGREEEDLGPSARREGFMDPRLTDPAQDPLIKSEKEE